MANGKGALSCSYCQHQADAGLRCSFHGVTLPVSPTYDNTICCNFEPAGSYWRDNSVYIPPARRFAWFGRDLEPGVLYAFPYNAPEAVEPLAVLRVPDYERGGWK